MEVFHTNGKRVSLIPSKSQRALEKVRREELQGQINSLSGVLIEDKGAILAFHYRQAPLSDQAALRNILLEVENKHFDALELAFGKMVMEIRPRCTINKGSAVNYLRKKIGMGAFPIYIGDDLTDADAFRVLKGKGLTIQVGQSELSTKGDYYLGDPGEVLSFLQGLRKNFDQSS